MSGASTTSRIKREIFGSPTISAVSNSPRIPARDITSASAIGGDRNTYRAFFNLSPGDVHALVRFGVGAQCHPMALREAAHLVEIRLKTLDIQQQTWRRKIEDFFHGLEFTTAKSTNFVDLGIHKLFRNEARTRVGVTTSA